jgi:hypothetical protein
MARLFTIATAEEFMNGAINGSNGRETQNNQLLKAIAILLFVYVITKLGYAKEQPHG